MSAKAQEIFEQYCKASKLLDSLDEIQIKSVTDEIIKASPDQEIVFDGVVNMERYVALRKFMAQVGCDVLVLVPPRITVGPKSYSYKPESEKEGRIVLGRAFGRYFYHEAQPQEPAGVTQ